jgi:hypothetical protein
LDGPGAVALVTHCISEIRNIAERSDTQGQGLDAKCAIVVEMDNVDLAATRYIERAPAPQTRDPLSYDSFIQRICDLYRRRFA